MQIKSDIEDLKIFLITKSGFLDESKMEAETRKIMARLKPNFKKFDVDKAIVDAGPLAVSK